MARATDVARQSNLDEVFNVGGVAIFANERSAVYRLSEDRGVILGELYCRHVPAPAFDGSADRTAEVTAACLAGELTERFWGSYIAYFTTDSGEKVCVRAPFGNINAYAMSAELGLSIASDCSTLFRFATAKRTIDWDAVAKHLIWDNLSVSTTCLTGVLEIRCGENARWSRPQTLATDFSWNPWKFADREQRLENPTEAAELVRRELYRCIGARVRSDERYSVDLSGGLDSSIIAAVVAASRCDAFGINLFSELSEGDERLFARSVAERTKIPLVEIAPDADLADIAVADRPHLPRPHSRSFMQVTDRAALATTEARATHAFLNGQGGDAVFCHLQSSGPLADSIQMLGAGPSVSRVAYEVARAAQCNVWHVARMGLIKAVRGKLPRHWPSDRSFMSRAVCDLELTEGFPWPDPQTKPLPGKVEHVHGLANSCYNMNSFRRSDRLKAIFPLLSQPLVEACLRIPTWLWVGSGRNRLIARRAMQKDLPQNVAWRVSKGSLGPLQRKILRRQLDTARAMLLEGSLATSGFLDRPSIEAQLVSQASCQDVHVGRLLRLCDFEAWCTAQQ